MDYVEVVEGIKEGYEADVLDPELELSGGSNLKDMLSDEEDPAKPPENESDEDFDITKYRDHPNLRVTSEDASIRYAQKI